MASHLKRRQNVLTLCREISRGHLCLHIVWSQNKLLAYVPATTKTAPQLSRPHWGGVAADHKSFFAERCQCRWNSVSIIAPYNSVGSLMVKANERVEKDSETTSRNYHLKSKIQGGEKVEKKGKHQFDICFFLYPFDRDVTILRRWEKVAWCHCRSKTLQLNDRPLLNSVGS